MSAQPSGDAPVVPVAYDHQHQFTTEMTTDDLHKLLDHLRIAHGVTRYPRQRDGEASPGLRHADFHGVRPPTPVGPLVARDFHHAKQPYPSLLDLDRIAQDNAEQALEYDRALRKLAAAPGHVVQHVEHPCDVDDNGVRMPTPNGGPYVHDLVAADLQQRKELGTERYGTPLQPANGRDALRDAYEELLDGACYLRQYIEEGRDLVGLQAEAVRTAASAYQTEQTAAIDDMVAKLGNSADMLLDAALLRNDLVRVVTWLNRYADRLDVGC